MISSILNITIYYAFNYHTPSDKSFSKYSYIQIHKHHPIISSHIFVAYPTNHCKHRFQPACNPMHNNLQFFDSITLSITLKQQQQHTFLQLFIVFSNHHTYPHKFHNKLLYFISPIGFYSFSIAFLSSIFTYCFLHDLFL